MRVLYGAALVLMLMGSNCKDKDVHTGYDSGCPALDWYLDGDGDGYGDGAATTSCTDLSGSGYVLTDGDCDDSDPSVHPGATEIAFNTIDEDCDGDTNDIEGEANGHDLSWAPDMHSEYSEACADAIVTFLADEGDPVISLELWQVGIVDSAKNSFLMELSNRRPVQEDTRSYRHPRGDWFGMGTGSVQTNSAQWDEYDAGVGARYLYLITTTGGAEIVGYTWLWEATESASPDSASATWVQMGRVHWAVDEPGCGHPTRVGRWTYTQSWNDAWDDRDSGADEDAEGLHGPWTTEADAGG